MPEGYRRVPHYDHQHHTRRYMALAHKLEEEARDWFTEARLDEIATRFEAAEADVEAALELLLNAGAEITSEAVKAITASVTGSTTSRIWRKALTT